MIDQIKLHREEVRALCGRFHVRRLYLFGSVACCDLDPLRSDVDFLVEFDGSSPRALAFDTCFGLKEALEALLGRPVDIRFEIGIAHCARFDGIEGAREPVFEV
jgi:uncharacterized protein